MRLVTSKQNIYFCFFYAPGDHHETSVRRSFYDFFIKAYDKFAPLGKVYLIGDTNARLGPFLNDVDINGRSVSNRNRNFLKSFLEYTGLAVLNKKYQFGVPTYEIYGKKRSIIDMCFTNSISSVIDFKVLPHFVGFSSQTCHKILQLTIHLRKTNLSSVFNAPKHIRFRTPSHLEQEKVVLSVCSKTFALLDIEDLKSTPDYFTLKKLFAETKSRSLGSRHRENNKLYKSNEFRSIQQRYDTAITKLNYDVSDKNTFLAANLEKELYKQYRLDRETQFLDWLAEMDSHDFNRRTRTFFSLLKRKTVHSETFCAITDPQGNLTKDFSETLEAWALYYEALYSCDYSFFDFPKSLDKDEQLNGDITFQEMLRSIDSLKGHKAPGFDNITNDDIRSFLHELNGGDIHKLNGRFLNFLFKILSDFWFNERVPHDLKRTIIRPFLKDSTKDAADPANYRPISLLNTIMKIYEGLICKRIMFKLERDRIISKAQAAYLKHRSTADHIFVLQELFLEYRFNKLGPRGGRGPKPLYCCFLDLRKAFDTVIRNILFKVLFSVGISDKILRVIQDLFSSNRANVLIDGYLSREFTINKGVLQGSKLGPILFVLFINELLITLENSKLGASIGSTHIAILGFADDIMLVSDSPVNLRKLISICVSWAEDNKMKFNVDKCKILIFNKPSKRECPLFELYGKPLEIVTEYKYLGIIISTKKPSNIFTTHFSNILEKAAVRVSTIRSYGFREDGFRLETSIKLYKLLVRPILEYCAQALCYAKYPLHSDRLHGSFVHKLEHFQTQTLKSLINAPKNSPPELVRLLCGVEPLASRFDLLKLRYFWKLTKFSDRNFARDIFQYRKKYFLDCNKGFCHEVFTMCCKYDAAHIWHGLIPVDNPVSRARINPLNRIKQIVSVKNLSNDLDKGRTRQCPFSKVYLVNPFNYQKKYHLVDVFKKLDAFHVRPAQGVFIRALLHCGNFPKPCNFCGRDFSDLLDHKVFHCPATLRHRQKLTAYLDLYNFPICLRPKSATDYINLSREHKLLRKCFTEFLQDVSF